MRFQILIESLSSIKKNSLAYLLQQSSLAFLGCGSVRILILQMSQRELKMRFPILFESLFSVKKNNLAFLMQQRSLANLGFGFVRNLFSMCLRGKL